MTSYDLRRLRLHGLIEKHPHSHRYEVTPAALGICFFFTKVYAQVLRPGSSQISERLAAAATSRIATALNRLEQAVVQHIQTAKLTPCEI